MVFLSVLFFFLYLTNYFILSINNNSIETYAEINKTQITDLFNKNNTLFPIDGADLLECSKSNGYILIDKTKNIPSYNTKNKLYPLESIYLSTQFFAIIESIAGTTGNFINDAILGISITQIIETLKNTNIEIYLGTIEEKVNLNNQVSDINLSCKYGNIYPSLTRYDYNNFCEYTRGLRKKNLLLNKDNICLFKNTEKFNFGDEMKYFNIIASLSIPILKHKEFDQTITSLNSNDFLNNDQINMNRYILLSNELGLSFFINIGIGLFGKKNYEKYYILIKMVPPNSFWLKDKNFSLNIERNDKIVDIKDQVKDQLFECNKYEKGSILNNNSIFYVEKYQNEDNLILESNSVYYLNIIFKDIFICLNKYKIIIYSNNSETFSIIKAFDINNSFIEMKFGKMESKDDYYFYEYEIDHLLPNIHILIVNKFKTTITYKVTCNYVNITLRKLFTNIYNLIGINLSVNHFKKSANKDNLNISIPNSKKKTINYSNKITYILLILLLLVIFTIVIKIFNAWSKTVLKNVHSKIDYLKLSLIEDKNIRKNDINNVQFSRYPLQNHIIHFNHENQDSSYKTILSQFQKHSPSSSLSSTSPMTFLSIPNNQICSPNQIDLYTAISNNISDNLQYNTDYSSSPSTIKSITFK